MFPKRIRAFTIAKILVLASLPPVLLSQTLHREEAARFVRALLWNRSALPSWFDPREVAVSRRLGIEYDGVDYKHLIGYDIDDSTRSLLKAGRAKYLVSVEALDRDYSRVIFTTGSGGDSREFLFRGKRWVSPLRYYARDWTTIESEHFKFFLSDTTLFNQYCVEQLEQFVTRMAGLLRLDDMDMMTLREQKIRYYLCRDEEEIRQLTGFRARGMYNLAFDAVVTTYNTHYHELLHLLVNFKLRHLPLYTHPFFQEGFAVAYGGRGGLEPEVLLPVGRFLYDSQSVELATLLEYDGFRQVDPSVSYPAAGLYNRFLVETIGINSYLYLYRQYSSAAGGASTIQITNDLLPEDSLWIRYIQGPVPRSAVSLDSLPGNVLILKDTKTEQVATDFERYFFLLAGRAVFPGTGRFPHYVSQTFRSVFPGMPYHGEEYLISVTAEQVSVYNLYTNNLIASYVTGFATPSRIVPRIGDRYMFSVSKDVFDDALIPTPARPENCSK